MAALDIKRKLNPDRQFRFYTYGSPRVGNQAFSDYLTQFFQDGLYSRVTHYNDMVPHVPPPLVGYNHAGNEVWYMNYGEDLSYKECENFIGKKESSECSNSQLIKTGIDAHLMYLGIPISNMCTVKDENP